MNLNRPQLTGFKSLLNSFASFRNRPHNSRNEITDLPQIVNHTGHRREGKGRKKPRHLSSGKSKQETFSLALIFHFDIEPRLFFFLRAQFLRTNYINLLKKDYLHRDWNESTAHGNRPGHVFPPRLYFKHNAVSVSGEDSAKNRWHMHTRSRNLTELSTANREPVEGKSSARATEMCDVYCGARPRGLEMRGISSDARKRTIINFYNLAWYAQNFTTHCTFLTLFT